MLNEILWVMIMLVMCVCIVVGMVYAFMGNVLVCVTAFVLMGVCIIMGNMMNDSIEW